MLGISTETFPIFILEAENYSTIFVILMWAGFSIGMHAFPSNDDMENFVQEVKNAKQGGILLIFAKPEEHGQWKIILKKNQKQ